MKNTSYLSYHNELVMAAFREKRCAMNRVGVDIADDLVIGGFAEDAAQLLALHLLEHPDKGVKGVAASAAGYPELLIFQMGVKHALELRSKSTALSPGRRKTSICPSPI